MLLLEKIKLNNFLSHDQSEFEIDKNQHILLDGPSGSGKSSIMDAILWALYGKARAPHRDLIKTGTEKAGVEVTLQRGENSYKIERSITQAGTHNLKIYENGHLAEVSGIRDCEEYIENEIVGCSYLLFINSICYPQNNQENFIKQNASTRKDILLEIIGANQYDEYYDRAKNKLDSLQDDLTVLKTKIDQKKQVIDDNGDLEEEISKLKEQKKELKEDIEYLESKVEELEEEKQDLEKLQVELKHIKEKKKEAGEQGKNLKEKCDEIEDDLAEIEEVNIEKMEKQKDVDDTEELEEEIEQLEEKKEKHREWDKKRMSIKNDIPDEVNIQDKKEELEERLEEIKDEHEECPGKSCEVCCEKYGESVEKMKEDVKEDISNLENKKEKNQKQREEKKKELEDHKENEPSFDRTELKTKREQLEHTKEVENEIKLAKEKKKQKDKLEKRLEEKQEELSEAREKYKKFQDQQEEQEKKLQDELEPIEDELEEIKETLDNKEEKLTKKKEKLSALKTKQKQVKEAKQQIEELKKEKGDLQNKKDKIELTKEAFSNQGIKSIMVDLAVPKLEKRMNDILKELSEFRIRLQTQKDKASGGGQKEGLFIQIINEQDEVLDISNYSGGEKIKINTAISEGLASMQDIGFRFWDENIVNFDSDTISSFITVMKKVQNRFKQLMCITHIQQVKEMFNYKIDIKKINGTSQITKQL